MPVSIAFTLLYTVFMLEILKGSCHQDFAVLVKFCAGVVMPLLTCIEKCFCGVVNTVMKQISLGRVKHNKMFW